MHCKRKVDAGCEVYLIRSAGVLDQTAAVLERMRAEADAIAPVARAVEVLPFEDVAVDGGASTELAERAVPAHMVFAWQLMDAIRAENAIYPTPLWCWTRCAARVTLIGPAHLCSVPGASSAATWDRW